jgi:hypothetical protein
MRLDIELWQYQRMLPDRLLVTKTVERTLAYNVVTREFKVAALKGETRPIHTTRDLRDAQRVFSDVRNIKISPAAELDPKAVIYVRGQRHDGAQRREHVRRAHERHGRADHPASPTTGRSSGSSNAPAERCQPAQAQSDHRRRVPRPGGRGELPGRRRLRP